MSSYPEKLIVIPDTHGHLEEVEFLLDYYDREGYLADHRLVFLGDYFDRGMYIKELIDLCVDLQKQGHIFLRGNHEYALHMALSKKTPDRDLWINRWGRKYEACTLSSYGLKTPGRFFWTKPNWQGENSCGNYDDPNQKWTCRDIFSLEEWRQSADHLLQAMPKEHQRFLTSLKNYYETDNFIFVHAGVTLDTWPRQQAEMCLVGSKGPSQLFSAELANQTYHRLNKTVVSGHAVQMQPEFFNKRVLLDCGVDLGRPLVSWIIDCDKLVSSDCQRSYQEYHQFQMY